MTTLLENPLDNSGPRTRLTDPKTSHLAGDTSQRSMRATKLAVLMIVFQNDSVTGSEINDLYTLRAARSDWARVAWDTPRKRAGELAEDGYLEIVGTRPAPGNNTMESVYGITTKGLAELLVRR